MKLNIDEYNEPTTLVVGALLANGYNVRSSTFGIRVSYPIFLGSMSRWSKALRDNTRNQNAETNIEAYLNYFKCSVKLDRYGMIGNIPITLFPPRKGSISFSVTKDVDCNLFECSIDFDTPIQIEVMLLTTWLSLDFGLAQKDIEIEGRIINYKLWLAAKLYEASGDFVGKLATIDEALYSR